MSVQRELPDMHDWEIEGVNADRFGNTVKIFLNIPANDEKSSLTLRGVKRFFLSNMAMQNVILDLLIFNEIEDSDYFGHCCRILKIESSIFRSEKNIKLIYFEPSVGAELACCFTDFNFDKT